MIDRFRAHLPIGTRVPLPEDAVPSWEIFPFEGDLRVKLLDEPRLPEAPRDGDDGPASCAVCTDTSKTIWADDHWRVDRLDEPTAVPVTVLLRPVGHHDLADLPPARAAEIGPMLQRVEQAVVALGGIARVHVHKWGDGQKHLHLWLIARPAGMGQLRGMCLPIWDNVLPKQDEQQWRQVLREVAANLAADGGTAYA